MPDLYDKDRIVDCFTNPDNERWKDAWDERLLMQMNHRVQNTLVPYIVNELRATMDDAYGAASVLDVGCGTAMLLDFFDEARLLHKVIKYTGCDLVEKFLDVAEEKKKKYRIDIELIKADFYALENPPTADLVIATQCLNTVFSTDTYGFLGMALDKLWKAANKRLIFDVKDERALKPAEGRVHYDPVKVYAMCRELTQNVKLVQSLQANVTVVLNRAELFD